MDVVPPGTIARGLACTAVGMGNHARMALAALQGSGLLQMLARLPCNLSAHTSACSYLRLILPTG